MNIGEYEFSDPILDAYDDGGEELQLDTGWDAVTINKDDVIALSKHFKLELALLNKLRNKFINSDHSCEHELLEMINSLELENE